MALAIDLSPAENSDDRYSDHEKHKDTEKKLRITIALTTHLDLLRFKTAPSGAVVRFGRDLAQADVTWITSENVLFVASWPQGGRAPSVGRQVSARAGDGRNSDPSLIEPLAA